MATAIPVPRIQDAPDYGDALTWAGAHEFQAGLTVSSGQVATIERINAVDGDGLALYDDGGNFGLFVKDGGFIGNLANPQARLHIDSGGATIPALGSDAALFSSSTNCFINIIGQTSGASNRWAGIYFGDQGTDNVADIAVNIYHDYMRFAIQNSEKIRILSNDNIGINTTDQFGGGEGVIGIANASTNPAANPTGGGVLYVNAGALTYRGSGGTVTVLGAA